MGFIKILSAYDLPALITIADGETPDTLEQKLMQIYEDNFKIELQETTVGRILPRDEVITPGREYYIVFTRLPGE